MNKKSKKKRVLVLGVVAFSLSLVIGCIAVVKNQMADRSHAGDSQTYINGTIFQGFEWQNESDGNLWNQLENDTKMLTDMGVTSFWLPPAYKGNTGYNVGYGVYDLYDLGEFLVGGIVRTKYGYKDQYLNLINTIHDNGGQVYADIVLNHRGGSEETEEVVAAQVDRGNTNRTISSYAKHTFYTKFSFEARNNKYSSFKWNASHFDGCDDEDGNVYLFSGKSWDQNVSTDNGNADFVLMCDYDFSNQEVVNELNSWGKWYLNETNIDGFRLDAVKHIDSSFMKNWVNNMRAASGKELFTVGEYYDGNINRLNSYLNSVDYNMSLFDYALYYKMREASTSGIDMRNIFKDTLTSVNPMKAVTFVDNHDVQCCRFEGEELANSNSYVQDWFKPIGYTLILTRQSGYPTVFYSDYYGSADGHITAREALLNKLLLARRDYAYGKQNDYFDDADVIGWTREGDNEHNNSGLAALVSDGNSGSKYMYVGTNHAGETWVDITGNSSGSVTIDNSGWACFYVNGRSCSVWVKSGDLSIKKQDNDGGVATVYYKTEWDNAYIHYQVGNGAWTDNTGIKMEESDREGYFKYVIDLGSSVTARGVFNNGANVWDDKHFDDYIFRDGITTIDGKNITFSKYASDDVIPTPSDEATKVINKSNFVSIYYKTDWQTPYIHYVAGNGNWTNAPGTRMYTSDFPGYVREVVEIGTQRNMMFCFNNGGSEWDSRGGNNYSCVVGEFTVENGTIVKGKPGEAAAKAKAKAEEDARLKAEADAKKAAAH